MGETFPSRDLGRRIELEEPFVVVNGRIAVPTGPGIGVGPIPEVLSELAVLREVVRP